MIRSRGVRISLVFGIASALSGCASASSDTHARNHVRPEVPYASQMPQRPVERHEDTVAVAAINRGIGTGETVWHVRSALNVAALSCRGSGYHQIAGNYNQMLRRHRAMLADAYTEEQAQFRSKYGNDWQRRQDRHITSVYNFFANPIAARQFCAEAMAVSDRVNALDSIQFREYSRIALARLERPIVNANSLAQR